MSDANAGRPVWTWDPETLAADLEAAGFDVDRGEAHLSDSGGSLTARRDRGERAELVVVDAGGRIRLRVTAVATEDARRASVAGVSLRVVTQRRVVANVTGTVHSRDEFLAILDQIDALADPEVPPDDREA
ncbi:MAG TPA: hypothetical protein VFQ80_19895 [Thermomicrobiales bacterium]|jgi:hypothetical protein|nr:hypothetical protein [Thermomicrobiales bacterium]